MQLKAFCLLDTKVQAFHAPFFMAHVGHAIRACSELAQDMSTTVGRHPADFMLFEVGTFDDQTGSLSASATPINHGPVLAFIPNQRHQGTLDIVPESGPSLDAVPSAVAVSDPATLARLNGRA